MDEKELDRIDLCHAKYYALLDKRRFLAPIPPHPQSVLDLGCGTGIWAIDFADAYPSAEVIGVDIAPTQPEWLPPNCRFEIFNMEEPWAWRENSFDYIFARDPITAIRDYPKLVDKIFRHLKPGGWVEFQCIMAAIQCDDDSLAQDSVLRELADRLIQACETFQTPVDDPLRWRHWLEERGFEPVTEKVFKVPCNPWPKDERLKLVGAFEMDNLLSNLAGLCMLPFKRTFGWSHAEVHEFVGRAKKDIRNLRCHAYWPFRVAYAQKPVTPVRSGSGDVLADE